MKTQLLQALPARTGAARKFDRFKEPSRRLAEVLISKEGRMYLACRTGPSGKPGGYVFSGPYDPDLPLAGQMAGRPEELAYASSGCAGPRLELRKAAILSGGGCTARVDLDDFISDQAEAVRAMRAGDIKALRMACPDPGLSWLADDILF